MLNISENQSATCWISFPTSSPDKLVIAGVNFRHVEQCSSGLAGWRSPYQNLMLVHNKSILMNLCRCRKCHQAEGPLLGLSFASEQSLSFASAEGLSAAEAVSLKKERDSLQLDRAYMTDKYVQLKQRASDLETSQQATSEQKASLQKRLDDALRKLQSLG